MCIQDGLDVISSIGLLVETKVLLQEMFTLNLSIIKVL